MSSFGIYLDHASTTPVDAEAVKAMGFGLGGPGSFGNPASCAWAFEVVEAAGAQVVAPEGSAL